jgi:hypothetical protein
VIAFAHSIYDTYFRPGIYQADFEISIDETTTPTTPLQHFFVANELSLRTITFATLAPRFCGEFQKGVDYIGDNCSVRIGTCRTCRNRPSLRFINSAFIPVQISFLCLVFWKTYQRSVPCEDSRDQLAGSNESRCNDRPCSVSKYSRFRARKFSEVTKYYHVSTNIANIPDIST